MNNLVGEKVLATTSAWFFAPDGKQYRAVWGTLRAIHTTKEALGFTLNARHTNWMVEIGDMTIVGSQLLYFMKCTLPPYHTTVEHVMYDLPNGLKTIYRPNEIYLAE